MWTREVSITAGELNGETGVHAPFEFGKTLNGGLTLIGHRPRLTTARHLRVVSGQDPRGRVENAGAPALAAPKVSWVLSIPSSPMPFPTCSYLSCRGIGACWNKRDRQLVSGLAPGVSSAPPRAYNPRHSARGRGVGAANEPNT
jgi:hypothetical protein